MAEQTSCTNPGSVSSAERAPPPIVEFASRTRTEYPARVRVIAAARPFGPDPTTTASYLFDIVRHHHDLEMIWLRISFARLSSVQGSLLIDALWDVDAPFEMAADAADLRTQGRNRT